MDMVTPISEIISTLSPKETFLFGYRIVTECKIFDDFGALIKYVNEINEENERNKKYPLITLGCTFVMVKFGPYTIKKYFLDGHIETQKVVDTDTFYVEYNNPKLKVNSHQEYLVQGQIEEETDALGIDVYPKKEQSHHL